MTLANDESIKRETHLTYVDDFNDPGSRWPHGDDKIYSSGRYIVGPYHGSYYWSSPRGIRTDSALEVVGRMKLLSPNSQGSWVVVLDHSAGSGRSGFMVKINRRGELFLRQPPGKSAKEPMGNKTILGPIVHSAIKPGDQDNALLLVMKQRTLQIFVNSVQVCEPVTYESDLTPGHLLLGAWDGKGDFQAEFARVEIREFWDGNPDWRRRRSDPFRR